MHRTAVLLVVALNRSLIGEHTPCIKRFAERGHMRRLQPTLPAVTCSVQSSMLTGKPVRVHGIVANGWYDRETSEVHFWKQSNRLVQAEKIWETAKRRDPAFTCANMFWWYNMVSSADYCVTPRPIYKADGRKIPDCYSKPSVLRDELTEKLGAFPLFQFWGPGASIVSTRWIADATMHVCDKHDPTLTLVYLPHLDYALQKLGPGHADLPAVAAEVDAEVGRLLDYFQKRDTRVMIVSEYGIEPVDDAVPVNRVLREAGALRVRREQGLELLDTGESDALAVVDHQVAHVYVRCASAVQRYADLCRSAPGVERVLLREDQAKLGIDHPRAGEIVLVAEARRWFSYEYWLDEARAPDFARTVDIHRKPGYDPLELFIDPAIRFPRLKLARRLLQRKALRMRALLDVIPLDTKLVRGSHGRTDQPDDVQPVMITQTDLHDLPERIDCTQVRSVMLRHVFEEA